MTGDGPRQANAGSRLCEPQDLQANNLAPARSGLARPSVLTYGTGSPESSQTLPSQTLPLPAGSKAVYGP